MQRDVNYARFVASRQLSGLLRDENWGGEGQRERESIEGGGNAVR